ncbi:MAG: ribosome maturation factor RimP [Bradymonadaceae bacterium]
MSDKNRKRNRRRRRRRQEDSEASGEAQRLTDEVRDQIEAWSEKAADANGLQLFEVEPTVRGRWIVRVYVERLGEVDEKEGVSVDECAEVSRYMEAYMDADDRIPENYMLEVSSPGLERPLKKPRHVENAIGEQVELVTRVQVDGKNKFVADLVGFEDEELVLELDELDDPVRIAWDDVAKGRLKYDF